MSNHFIFIDLENVQPEVLGRLDDTRDRVWVFIGKSQSKLPTELVTALHPLGGRLEYKQISGSGKNALDFHIAFYLGSVSAVEKQAEFTVVSRDKGFDPLVDHLRSAGFKIQRVDDLGKSVPKKTAKAPQTTRTMPVDRSKLVIEKLRKPKASRPKTLKGLTRTVAAYFAPEKVSDDDARNFIGELEREGLVAVTGQKVEWRIA